MKKALITGINGQDGSYLAELLLDKGYKVYGILKRNSVAENQTARIEHLYPEIKHNLYHADMTDMASLFSVIKETEPNEIYNLAAQSHVMVSFKEPIYTMETIAKGTLNLLELIRLIDPKIKLYQASSSEMFGNSCDEDGFQRETTPMNPVSPYACSKLCAFNLVKCYREAYNLFASNGILFNHESPRRGTTFVTNKVVREAVRIYKGLSTKITLGNLDSRRDWGHAKDYVHMMWAMLQLEKPEDYICATGISKSVRDLCEYTFGELGMDYRDYVEQDSKFMRPLELKNLRGCADKLKKDTNLDMNYTFETMLDEMIDYWMRNIHA